MRPLLFVLLMVPSIALAQAPGETAPVQDPGKEPDVHPPTDKSTPAPSDTSTPAPSPPADAPPPANSTPSGTSPSADSTSAPDSSAPGATSSSAPGTTPPSATPIPSAPTLTHLDPLAVPAACKTLAKDADAASLNRKLSARISLASCLADAKLKPLVLCDCEQSVIDVNNAAQLPLMLLDEVYAMGDASMKILARQMKGDLLSGFTQRIEATVPAPVGGTPEAIALHDTRVDLLQPMLDPWNTQARSAYTDVDKLAKANPQLAKNTAVLAAVRASRAKLGTPATQTAKR